MEKASCDCLSTTTSMKRCTSFSRKPPSLSPPAPPAFFLPLRCRWPTMRSKKRHSVSKLIWEGGMRPPGACEAWEGGAAYLKRQ